MCNDHALPDLSRRHFLGATGTLAAGALLPAGLRGGNRLHRARPPRPSIVDPWGNPAFSNAMHIHSSFSEYQGSMDAQLAQATLNGVDVCWWTDHAERLDAWDYWCTVHCTSLTAEKPAPGQGTKPWVWKLAESGPNSPASAGGIVTTPCSPNDPVVGGAISLTAQSTTTATAKYGYTATLEQYRCNLGGQSISIDVMLNPGWEAGYLEVHIATSYHGTGTYTLSYRVVPSGVQGRIAQGRTGIVTVPVVADGVTWTTVTLTPQDDIAALWPLLDSRDFGLYEITLNAASTGDLVSGYFDYLRFTRTLDGGELFAQQASMMQALASEYPLVTQQQGLEVSWGLPHVNWFGGNVAVPDFAGLTMKEYPAWVEQQVIPGIHQSGGLASFNHWPGTSWTLKIKPAAAQDELVAQVGAELLAAGLYGCDILEVGYPQRAGVDLAHNVAMWDIMSRNAVFVTGNGTSDDHWAGGPRPDKGPPGWAGSPWNWKTDTWAASTAQSDLLASLAAGRVYCGSLSAPPVALDLLVDGEVPMGAVSVSSLTSRQLAVTAAGLPDGWTLGVLQGDVDYAGTSGLESNAEQVASFGSGDLDGNGQATLGLDTSAESYVRTILSDENGVVQGLSNPVWLLQNTPPNGIPAPREA